MKQDSNGIQRFLFVQENDLANRVSSLYHENSKLGEFRVRFGLPDPKKERETLALINQVAGRSKGYRFAPRVPLVSPLELDRPLGRLLRERRSRRQMKPVAIGAEKLATLLVGAVGVTGKLQNADGSSRLLRAYPSGGALYPLEIYAAVLSVEGVAPGLYYVDVIAPALALLRAGDLRESLWEAFIEEPMVKTCGVVLIITALFQRSRFKYGERSYRFILLEAGHLGQNLVLAGESLGLSVVPMGGFLDRQLEALLEVDGVEESVIHTMLVGTPEA